MGCVYWEKMVRVVSAGFRRRWFASFLKNLVFAVLVVAGGGVAVAAEGKLRNVCAVREGGTPGLVKVTGEVYVAETCRNASLRMVGATRRMPPMLLMRVAISRPGGMCGQAFVWAKFSHNEPDLLRADSVSVRSKSDAVRVRIGACAAE